MPQDKPPKVGLNLDALDREGAPEPFVVTFDGKPMTFKDAAEIDWQDLIRAQYDPRFFFTVSLSEADAKRFLEKKLPTWKMEKLMAAYNAHYGIDDMGKRDASSS